MGRKNQVLTILFFALFTAACTTGKRTSTPTLEIRKKTEAPETDTLLTRLLSSEPRKFSRFLDSARRNDVQIIYTQIDRDENNKPSFTHHYFHLDPNRYFYPASTVKLPIAALALQKLRALNIRGLDKNSTMITGSGFNGLAGVYNDPTTPDGRPTIAQYIRKILLVSDNDAFNRLYEFLGQEYINSTLHKMGYDSVQILHRLDIFLTEEENRHTNPVAFYDGFGRLLYKQPLVRSTMAYQYRDTKLGNGFMRSGQLVQEPFDFSKKNRLSLADLHSIVQSIIFPDAIPSQSRFHLEEEDYHFLRRLMSAYPHESDYPSYDSSYKDTYVKFLFYGSTDTVQKHLRIFNKVGDAYGFLTDAAYFMDTETGIEFLLSAVIHCNSDGVYNDNKYDYETIGLPFMRDLGRLIYSYEIKRPRKRMPDLSGFQYHLP